ncbi:hypothetical protein NW766_008014 [Fusarium irregulare]|uniref:Uncharacterized protein n=1 Tax=Fusarium irregulare TaxID=2494466 RepID=A0A9W8PLY5_9HYPO|nr:hypothetical protein NW766_008014 [Fusarium irregulare]
MNPMEAFFYGIAGGAFHPTFNRISANESRQYPVPTPIPWFTPPPPKVHHWRGGFSDSIDQGIFIGMVVGSVAIWCGLALIWFRIKDSEPDIQRVLPLKDEEDGIGTAPSSQEMQQLIREPIVASSSGLRRSMEEAFAICSDDEDEEDREHDSYW